MMWACRYFQNVGGTTILEGNFPCLPNKILNVDTL